MTRWIIGLTAVGLFDLIDTIYSVSKFRPTLGGPSVMTLSEALGFITSISLLCLAGFLLVVSLRSRRRRRQFATG